MDYDLVTKLAGKDTVAAPVSRNVYAFGFGMRTLGHAVGSPAISSTPKERGRSPKPRSMIRTYHTLRLVFTCEERLLVTIFVTYVTEIVALDVGVSAVPQGPPCASSPRSRRRWGGSCGTGASMEEAPRDCADFAGARQAAGCFGVAGS